MRRQAMAESQRMDGVSAAGSGVAAADAASPHSVAVARKALDVMEAIGAATVELIEQAAPRAPDKGARVDVYA